MSNLHPQSRLLLNIAPVHFANAKVTVGVLPFESSEQLQTLREQYAATHLLRRAKNCIWALPIGSNASPIGESVTEIFLYDHMSLCADLVRYALINYFSGKRRIQGWNPLRLLGRTMDDLLNACMPPGQLAPSWLGVRPQYHMTVRPIRLKQRQPFVGIALDMQTTRLIELNVASLIETGFSPVGHYVGRWLAQADSRMSPTFELLGRVQSVDSGQLLLDDAREGVTAINAQDAWLEKRAFNACLAHVFKNATPAIEAKLIKARATLQDGAEKLKRLEQIRHVLAQAKLEILPDVPLTVAPFIPEDRASAPLPVESTPRPVFVFHPSGKMTDTWADGGLNKFGPYSAQTFSINRPRICVVCQRNHKGQVEQFLRKFFDGITLPQGKNYYERGWQRKYALKEITLEFFLVEGDSGDAYRQAVQRALSQHETTKWDLALIQIKEAFHLLSEKDNPYYLTKATFLTAQIPVQEFELETTQKTDRQLTFILNNMGLATYAKLGGIPWLIKSDPTIANELVIGLGSTSIGDGRLGDRERLVGITTVFSGDGAYWLSNVSQAVPMAEYQSMLLRNLKDAINKTRQAMNWQAKEPVRLIFHASFKRFSNDEIEAVKAVVAGLGDFDVEYAFLQINEKHPYLLFDTQQEGAKDFETNRTKGKLAPARGGYLPLSERETLLVLTGPKEVKRPEDGVPRPVLLSLHHDSTFTDMTYIVRQVFAFASHSWRTFLPASMPVTIQYSDLIATRLGHLAAVPRWNPDTLLWRIGRTRWFL